MSFWINTKNYRSSNLNGTNFINVGGVPGGLDNRENFLKPIEDDLHKSNLVITPKIVAKAIRLQSKIDRSVGSDLKKSPKWWKDSLHGKSNDVEDLYNFPGAAYLVWFLFNHEGKTLAHNFSY